MICILYNYGKIHIIADIIEECNNSITPGKKLFLLGGRYEAKISAMMQEERLAWYEKFPYPCTINFEKHAKENGFKNTRVFIDDGWSDVTFTRPAFSEIMEFGEQENFSTLIVKDHSRLVRNRLVVGQLPEEEFDRTGIRYIAIMDNIDTAKSISDIVPMQDLFKSGTQKSLKEFIPEM